MHWCHSDKSFYYSTCTVYCLVHLLWLENYYSGKDIKKKRPCSISIICLFSQLAHPVLESLKGTPHGWLIELLYAFNSGMFSPLSTMYSSSWYMCTYPASRGYIFSVWAVMQKAASANNRSIFYHAFAKFATQFTSKINCQVCCQMVRVSQE